MICGTFWEGSGLGNQLHRYVATRVLSLDKGYKFEMALPQNFKGKSFMNLDMGGPAQEVYERAWVEKKVTQGDVDVRSYDPEFNFIKDNCCIDGEFQDERYFGHRLKEIDEWLKVEPLNVPDDVCVIGFRGGEYYTNPDLGLPMEYWSEALMEMNKMNPKMKYEVHTDDIGLALKYFPTFKIIHDIGVNWRSMRYAKYAIIANSSFYILPRLLSGGVTIAPRYWARRNIKIWSMTQNYYKYFQYI